MTGVQFLEVVENLFWFVTIGIILPAFFFTVVRHLTPADEGLRVMPRSDRFIYKVACYAVGLLFLLAMGVRYEWKDEKAVELIFVAGFMTGGLSFLYGVSVDLASSLMSIRIQNSKKIPFLSGVIIIVMGGLMLALPYLVGMFEALLGDSRAANQRNSGVTVNVDQARPDGVDGVAAFLQSLSAELNKDLPAMVDEVTRLNSTSFVPSSQLVYNFTITNLSYRNISASSLSEFSSDLVSKVCADDEMREIFSKGITAVYSYKSSDGREILRTPINSNHCSTFGTRDSAVLVPKRDAGQVKSADNLGQPRVRSDEVRQVKRDVSPPVDGSGSRGAESSPSISQRGSSNANLSESNPAVVEYQRRLDEVDKRRAAQSRAVGKRWDYKTGKSVWVDAEGKPIPEANLSND